MLDYNRRANPDGFGIAWRDKKGLHHEKFAPKDYDAFHKLLKSIDKRKNVEYVAHFRKATHGDICQAMSHPFTYEDKSTSEETLVFHNGIIAIPTQKGESDTAAFVRKVLANLVGPWWEDEPTKWLVENSVGWSRLLVMNSTETVRLNESDWKTMGGIWYSTNPYPSQPKYASSGKGGTSYGSESFPYGSGYTGGGMVKRPYTPPSEWTDYDEDDDDDDEEDFLKTFNDQRSSDTYVPSSGWADGGHWVHPLSQIDIGDGNKSGDATCDQCNTLGSYYIVDGKVYIEVVHGKVKDSIVEGSLKDMLESDSLLLLPAGQE